MVQMSQAIQIRKEWKAQGSPPCDHPETDREYDLGSHTGDRVCLTCGECFSPNEWAEMQRKPGS